MVVSSLAMGMTVIKLHFSCRAHMHDLHIEEQLLTCQWVVQVEGHIVTINLGHRSDNNTLLGLKLHL